MVCFHVRTHLYKDFLVEIVESGFSLQSSEALEFLKRDLTEFSTVVQHDTACSIVATATAVKNKLAVSCSLHLGHCFLTKYLLTV